MSKNASNPSIASPVPPQNVHNQIVLDEDREKSSSTGKKRPRAQLNPIETGNLQCKKLANWEFDADSSRLLVVKMIAKHDYRLNMVTHAYFREFVKSLNPSAADLVLDMTAYKDILKLYSKLKLELQECLGSLTSKCSLTVDMWTVKYTPDRYCCVTCHYIDDNWTLQKKVIAFVLVPFPQTGEVLGEVVKSVALEWNIDNKLFALAAYNAFSTDVMMRNIKEWLNGKGSLVLEGDLFQMRCSNQILHLIAQKGLDVAAGLIAKIRECVKYIWSSPIRTEKFESALMQVKLAGRSVYLDVDNYWYSTYSMLTRATDLRQGFVRLAKLDNGFKFFLPNSDEWEQGIMIGECLKVFYDMIDKYSQGWPPTTAMYFKNIYEVNKNIRTWESSTHKYIREMALEMRREFDKYWSTCSLLMSIGVVLDPRYKAQVVDFVFRKLHGEHLSKTYISDFRQAINTLFSSYESQRGSSVPDYFGNSFTRVPGSASIVNYKVPSETDLEFDEFLMQNSNAVIQKTELESYLEEPLFPKGADESNFDVLSWWKINGLKYPTLARMARDILAVPVSFRENAFSGGDRVLTEDRTYYVPEVVQALSCLKSWLP